MQFFADHTHWRGVATGQAFHKFDAVIPIGADRDGTMHFFSLSGPLDSKRRAKIFH